MCPGMFNALNGMGGGGLVDSSVNSKANTALYTTFAVVGFGAGTFLNICRSQLPFLLLFQDHESTSSCPLSRDELGTGEISLESCAQTLLIPLRVGKFIFDFTCPSFKESQANIRTFPLIQSARPLLSLSAELDTLFTPLRMFHLCVFGIFTPNAALTVCIPSF